MGALTYGGGVDEGVDEEKAGEGRRKGRGELCMDCKI